MKLEMSIRDKILRYFQNKLLSNKKFDILHSSMCHKNKLTMKTISKKLNSKKGDGSNTSHFPLFHTVNIAILPRYRFMEKPVRSFCQSQELRNRACPN